MKKVKPILAPLRHICLNKELKELLCRSCRTFNIFVQCRVDSTEDSTMIAMTVGRIRRSQTVALTVIVDYECEYEVSCCLPLCPLSFVQLTIVIAYVIMQWLKVRRVNWNCGWGRNWGCGFHGCWWIDIVLVRSCCISADYGLHQTMSSG